MFLRVAGSATWAMLVISAKMAPIFKASTKSTLDPPVKGAQYKQSIWLSKYTKHLFLETSMQ